NCVRAFGSYRYTEPSAAVVKSSRPAAALDIHCHQACRGADDAAAAHGQNANARFAYRYARNASGGKGGDVRATQSLAGSPEWNCRIAITASQQYTFARIDRHKRLGQAAGNLHGVNRRNTIGSRWQRLPGLNARGHADKRRRSVTSRAKRFV